MRSRNLIAVMCEHKVASNILMLMMLLTGAFAITKLNTQFLPTFKLDFVNIQIIWPSASAEDVEKAIVIPLEQELTSINYVKEMTSTSSEGSARITLEFFQGTDIGQAIEEVKQQVALIRNLPQDSEPPQITKIERLESIASLILYGTQDLEALRSVAYQIKRELLAQGIAKVEINGLPELEIAIPFSSQSLVELQQSLPTLANRINQESQTLPAGKVGESEWGYSLKSPGKATSPELFEQLFLATNEALNMSLSSFSSPVRRAQKNEPLVRYLGQPAVEIKLLRTESADSLKSADILHQWLDENQNKLGQAFHLVVTDEAWKPIWERISLLVKNGLGGLFLILIILFLFLEKRIAFWVSVGIPVSFAVSLFLLWILGGSINMVSLFAFIMTLGIIVDDTIVVGENAYTRLQNNIPPTQAATEGALRMLSPIIASSLTTVAAFLPLMLIGGIIGTILFDIPLVAICVISVSLLECFLVLPGHIAHSFNRQTNTGANQFLEKIRIGFDRRFTQFRDHRFKQWIQWSINNQLTTLSFCLGILIIVFALPLTGRINFQFFPTPDSGIIQSHIQFVSGTPPQTIEKFVSQVENALNETAKQYSNQEGKDVLLSAVTYLKKGSSVDGETTQGDYLASLTIELTSPDHRDVSNQKFINSWKNKIISPPGLEKFNIFSRRGGPPGKDIDIDLIGTDASSLKQASIKLQQALSGFTGVFNIEDNLPYGKPELVFYLTPEAKSLNITVESLGRQLRAAYDGAILQIVNDQEDEIEVRTILPNNERQTLASLAYLPIQTPSGNMIPLNTIATLKTQKGLGTLKHTDGLLTNRISAEIDTTQLSTSEVLAFLTEKTLPDLIDTYGIRYKLKGRSEDQAQTLADMGKGVILAITMIYLILTWVFSSYARPFIIMAVLPFGITGAILGHWIMGIDMTILSLFGFFGLSGIVVNDSIILVSFYQELRTAGMRMQKAIVEAVQKRLRAVLLTSLTTIAGLLPLLFETSLQAQFLVPMAIAISFGLLFTTLLVLFVVPILLYWEEKWHISRRWRKRKSSSRAISN